jgi:hypothetical protein
MIALVFCYMYTSNTHQESYQLFRFAKINSLDLATRTWRSDQEAPKPSLAAHGEMYMSMPTSTFGCIMLTTRHMAARALPQPCHASSCRLVALALAVRPVTASRDETTYRPDCTGSTAPMPCIRTRCLATRFLVGRSPWLSPCVRSLHLAARLLVVRIAAALLCLCRASGRVVSTLDFSSVVLALAVCPVIPLCVVTTRLVAATDILRLCLASGCLGTSCSTSRGSSRGSSRRSSLTTSLTPRVRVARDVAQALAVCPVIPLCVVTTRLVVTTDILRLCRASGCLGTSCSTSRGSSRGSSRRSSSTTSLTPRIRVPRHVARLVARLIVWLVVDYFDYVARPGASARREARHAARRAARRRLLRLHRASGCLGTSRGSLSTTSTTPCVWVPRHFVRLVAPLVVDSFDNATRLGAPASRAGRRTARLRLAQARR